MKIVINIDEDVYKSIIADASVYVLDDMDMILLENAIYNGTPLPKGHGDLIDRSDLLEYTDISISAYTPTISRYNIITAPTIIPADKEE